MLLQSVEIGLEAIVARKKSKERLTQRDNEEKRGESSTKNGATIDENVSSERVNWTKKIRSKGKDKIDFGAIVKANNTTRKGKK